MREEGVTCDICGRLLAPTHDAMPWSPAMQFDSVKITYIHNGKEVNFDICPRCLKRMKRYLAREAKKDGGAPMIDKTMRKATGKQCSKIVGAHCGRLQELAEALCGDWPESDRAGAEKDDGQQRVNLQSERRTV